MIKIFIYKKYFKKFKKIFMASESCSFRLLVDLLLMVELINLLSKKKIIFIKNNFYFICIEK